MSLWTPRPSLLVCLSVRPVDTLFRNLAQIASHALGKLELDSMSMGDDSRLCRALTWKLLRQALQPVAPPCLVHGKQGCSTSSMHPQARPGMAMPQGPVDANGLPPSMGMPPFMPPPNPHARMQAPEGRLRQQYDAPTRPANGLVALDVILQGSQGAPTSTDPQVQLQCVH